ncbi:MAG: hypothetical protein JHC33_06180 [Ignisphaera sp.]|nr:hypothetical protein [Ignisphaera sp.]
MINKETVEIFLHRIEGILIALELEGNITKETHTELFDYGRYIVQKYNTDIKHKDKLIEDLNMAIKKLIRIL